MSRIAKAPVPVPSGVEVSVTDGAVKIKGPKGDLSLNLHASISLEVEDNVIRAIPANDSAVAMAGTFRSLVNNMVVGVSDGFEKKLTLVGVGYRAQVSGSKLTMALGFSHPIEYDAPEGISIETPSQTEIVVKGCDKQRVGQVAAEIQSLPSARALQGQRRSLLGRACRAQGSEEGLTLERY